MRMRTVLAALALTAVTLSGCSSTDDGEAEETTAQEESAQAGAAGEDQDLDTGAYWAKFRTPFKVADSADDLSQGIVTEGTQLGNNMPVPYEIDDTLTGGFGRAVITHSNLGNTVGYMTFADEYDDRLQSGYMRAGLAGAAGEDRTVGTVVLRYNSAETAEEVARRWAEAALTPPSDEDVAFPENTPVQPGRVSYPGLPNSTVVTGGTASRSELTTLTTHNEFFIYTVDRAPVGEEGESKEARDERLEFSEKFVSQELPALDGAVLHRTEEGFGQREDWPGVDPEGILRYALALPEGEDMPGFFSGKIGSLLPYSYNRRGFVGAGDYWGVSAFPEALDGALEAAGVEHVGYRATAVAQARDESGAQALYNSLISLHLAEDYQKYEEPQGLKDTTCVEARGSYEDYRLCFMLRDDKVSIGWDFSGELDEEEAPVNTDSTDPANTEGKSATEPKARLSQKMAAQHLLFEDAKANPEGTKPPESEAVNNPDEEDGEAGGEAPVSEVPASEESGSEESGSDSSEAPVN
ncbi:DUF7373 family lipoprotein [Corynebacterium frankenforstense]